MKIQYCSDLHLEFPRNKAWLDENPIIVAGDVLLLAGDIMPFTEIKKHDSFFDQMADQFEQVYWIPGNHEYYGSNIENRTGAFREAIRDNVWLLNNQVIQLPGAKLIFSTMWTSISPNNQWPIQRGMNDFRVIKKGLDLFTPEQSNELHLENMKFIKSEVHKNPDEKLIVITHHVPTNVKYPPKFLGSILNEAFSVELYDFISKSQIDHWIFGHHHCNVGPFTIGNTQLITNQLGYVGYGEQEGFECDKLI